MKKERCALASTPPMWETVDGGRCSWTGTHRRLGEAVGGAPCSRAKVLRSPRSSGPRWGGRIDASKRVKKVGWAFSIDITTVGDKRWRPPLLGEEGHAVCQAIHKKRRRRGVGTSMWKQAGRSTFTSRAPCRKAKTLWKVTEAKGERTRVLRSGQ